MSSSSSLKQIAPQVLQVNRMMPMTPDSLPPGSLHTGRGSDLPPDSLAPPSYTPPLRSTPPQQFAPSQMAEGHLPLLNQVLQHAKRWIDWDYQLDPKSPPTTPTWDASGKMSGVLVCQGRGNTKKLAKNDAARRLVGELQARLGRSGGTTPDLAKELERWYLEKSVCASHPTGMGELGQKWRREEISHLETRKRNVKFPCGWESNIPALQDAISPPKLTSARIRPSPSCGSLSRSSED